MFESKALVGAVVFHGKSLSVLNIVLGKIKIQNMTLDLSEIITC